MIFGESYEMPESDITKQAESLSDSRLPFILNSQQQTLFNALLEKDASLARIYLGAIRVLGDDGNPDRIALASHNIRELINLLPRYLGVDIQDRQVRLGDKVANLRAQWHRACEKSNSFDQDNWQGEIDQPLKLLLEQVKSFFTWYDDYFRKRKVVVLDTLLKLDPAPIPLPDPIADLHVEEWEQYYNFFVALAHHGRTITDEEVASWLYRLERFLIDRLQPRTFEEIDEIDQIIRQAEENDKS
jgi:hypothetical protein